MSNPTRVLRITALAVCAAWVPVIVVWRHAPFTITFDDAYYYFQIGKEIAHGHGSTFNGLDHTKPNTLGPGGLRSLSDTLDQVDSLDVDAVAVTGKPFCIQVFTSSEGEPGARTPANTATSCPRAAWLRASWWVCRVAPPRCSGT